MEQLIAQKFDAVVDLQNDAESRILKNRLGIDSFTINKRNFLRFVFKRLKWNLMPDEHEVDRNMQTVAPLGVVNDGEGLDFFIPKQEEVTEKDIPASHHLGYIALVIGGSYFTKKMPVEKIQELCRAIHHPVMLLGGKEDFDAAYAISQTDAIKIYNACGKFSLNESADLLKKSKLVISHDTGLMHIAAALKKPVISIWGSTTPSFGMTPYYGSRFLEQNKNPFDNVQVHRLWCRPCTDTGREECPQGHFKCMKKISVEEIVQLVNKRLGRS
jgi:heptosyltransferase-2